AGATARVRPSTLAAGSLDLAPRIGEFFLEESQKRVFRRGLEILLVEGLLVEVHHGLLVALLLPGVGGGRGGGGEGHGGEREHQRAHVGDLRHRSVQASSKSRRGSRGSTRRGSPWPRLQRKFDFTRPSGKNSASTFALSKPDIPPTSRPTARAASMK